MRSSMRASAAGIALTVTVLALCGAAAQPREPEDAATAADAARSAIEAHRVTVSGEQRPDDIPFRARMQTFFRRFHTETERVARELALTPEDRERLTAFAKEALADYARFARRQMETWCSHVEEFDSEPRDTARWVSELEALAQEQQREDEWTQRYAAALESLSSRARDSIRRYVDTRIVPQMSWTTIDFVGLAQDAPEAAAALLRGRCKPDRYAPPGHHVDVVLDDRRSDGGPGLHRQPRSRCRDRRSRYRRPGR